MFMVSIGKASTPDGNEFTKIRLEYAVSPQAVLHWISNNERKALLELYQSDKKKFVEAGAAWLDKCPVDAKIQLMMGSALSELGRSMETVKYRYFFYGLMRSIIADHDGLSKASAFKVISIDEEYALCNYLNAKVIKQELDDFYDALQVEINGEKKKLYFDASIPLEAIKAELKE
jgi:folate-dependent tRNA-U54 methylase TrmFO/GidA